MDAFAKPRRPAAGAADPFAPAPAGRIAVGAGRWGAVRQELVDVGIGTGERSARLDRAQREILSMGKARWIEQVEETRMIRKMAGVVALGVSAVLVFTGALMPDEAACYTALRGDECVATGESLALYGASHLPERFGYTCVGSACAAQPQLGSLLSVVSCAEAAPDGYTLDVKAGRCVAP